MKRTLVVVLVWCALGGCHKDVELLPTRANGASDGGHNCAGLGPAIQLPRASASQCGGALAAEAHRYAVCGCAVLSMGQSIETDAIDSTGLSSGSRTTAAIGGNAGLTSMASMNLGGALHIAGGAVSVGGQLQIAESLRVGGALSAMANVNVASDAFIAGDVSGNVTIVGALHLPSSANVAPMVSAGSTVREMVLIAPPCNCSPASFVDVAQAVSAAASANDDASIGLGVSALSGSAAPGTLDLPCGTFFVSSISPAADLTINVHGRTALVVMGDVTLTSRFIVRLDAGAELDLIVGGTLTASGGHELGSTSAPARMRIWIGGTTVTLEGDAAFGAILNAPRAQLSSPAGLELFGSVLAQSFNMGGSTIVHYDRAVLSGGVVCGMSAQPAIH